MNPFDISKQKSVIDLFVSMLAGKCKDDKAVEEDPGDLTSAYLGPQIWNEMLLSDDLKLEPVNLDDLLDPSGGNDMVSLCSCHICVM